MRKVVIMSRMSSKKLVIFIVCVVAGIAAATAVGVFRFEIRVFGSGRNNGKQQWRNFCLRVGCG